VNWPEAVTIPVLDGPEDNSPTLTITRGIQGSGKTTWAKAVVYTSQGGTVRVNRDELRLMMLRAGYSKPNPPEEHAVTLAQRAAVEALLRGGRSVIVDDMNLRARYVREWLLLARDTGAGAMVTDFTQVPLDVCLARDAQRANPVGEQVIRDTHARYLAGQTLPLPVPELPSADPYAEVEPYTAPDHPRPTVFLVDLDGTLALMNGRSPYDETRVGEDLPNRPVIEVVKALIESGLTPIYLSGRTAGCREATEKWLVEHLGLWHTRTGGVRLFMRKVGDQRPDWQVKLDLFNAHVRDNCAVLLAIDDRNQVVKLWRQMGLTCLQVADGEF
jgi:predicted kinase